MASLLDGLDVVLVKTRFPENIGMAARACVNMGCSSLRLVDPERWDREKARPLATPKGQDLLDGVTVSPDLSEAEVLARGERVALVFGPEDRGLNNEEITHCHKLTTIPTDPAASSLNLAQAVLLLLYECANAVRNSQKKEGGRAPGESGGGKLVTAAEQERLMESVKDMLLRLDYLHGDNPDYFLMPWRRLFTRAGLRRHEYDALMGLCRQVRHKLG